VASVIVRPALPVPPPAYVLTLSQKEAQALLDLTWYIGGPIRGPRGYFNDNPHSICEVLQRAGLVHRLDNCNGVVTFL
jgi:hypothetical protein